jgi:hypothetical protein
MKSPSFLLRVENQVADTRCLEAPSWHLTIVENRIEREKRTKLSAFRGLLSPLSALLPRKPRPKRLVFPLELAN